MRITRPMLITFYIVIGLTALILTTTRVINGLHLNAVVSGVVCAFCIYRLLAISRRN